MSRGAEKVWRDARKAAQPEFPDPPPHLSEPGYADLLFLKHAVSRSKLIQAESGMLCLQHSKELGLIDG